MSLSQTFSKDNKSPFKISQSFSVKSRSGRLSCTTESNDSKSKSITAGIAVCFFDKDTVSARKTKNRGIIILIFNIPNS